MLKISLLTLVCVLDLISVWGANNKKVLKGEKKVDSDSETVSTKVTKGNSDDEKEKNYTKTTTK